MNEYAGFCLYVRSHMLDTILIASMNWKKNYHDFPTYLCIFYRSIWRI